MSRELLKGLRMSFGRIMDTAELVGEHIDASDIDALMELRGICKIGTASIARIDAYLAAPNNKCQRCDGKGWTAEHSTNAHAHDGEGNCNPGYCPVQVQCEACEGTGLAAPSESAMDVVRKIREELNSMFYLLDEKQAAALIEGLQRTVPRAMLEEAYLLGFHNAIHKPASIDMVKSMDDIAAHYGVEVE